MEIKTSDYDAETKLICLNDKEYNHNSEELKE